MRSLATTDDDGRFERMVGGPQPLDVLVKGNVERRDRRTVSFERLPWRGEARGVVPGGPEVTIRCREIASDRTITIRVTDPDGAPLAGMYVWSFNAGTPPPRGETDDAGIVVLEGLLAEECTFMVNVVGEPRPEWLAPAARHETPAGQTIEMRFRRAAQITGTVLGRDGEPVSGAGVTARLADGSTFSATTGAEGHFALPVPADEPGFALTASWVDRTTGLETIERKAVPPDTDVTLQAK